MNNIVENNKLIAEFIGYKCSINEQYELPNMMTFPPKKNNNLCHTAKVCCPEDMQFHSDWNWLMEVVQKIEDLGNDVAITSNYAQIAYNEGEGFISIELKGRIMLEAVYSACVEFIKWYNQNTN